METQGWIDKEPRFLTKFEEESLKDWYWKESDFEKKSEDNFKDWYESMGWLDIDLIVGKYTKEDDGQ